MTVLSAEGRGAFEEGASLMFSLWSALSLAIDNEFGGRHSREKAQQLWTDVVQWFYEGKGRLASSQQFLYCRCLWHACMRVMEIQKMVGAFLTLPILSEAACFSSEHYADDLELDLQDAMEQDFHMVLEDGSPLQVLQALAHALVAGAVRNHQLHSIHF